MGKRKRHHRLPANNPPARKPPLDSESLLPVISLLLVFVTALAFWQVGSSDFINFDDNAYVTANSHVRQGITGRGIVWAFTTGHASNWHPLTWISHMVDVQLFGLRPTWHHLMNLLFHIAGTVLLFFVLQRMTKALWQSAFVAALFALHPLHVESVAWVAERKDVLSTFFWVLTMGAYAGYVERPGLKRYLAVCGCFVLGLLSKPMLVTLPFVLLLLDYWPLGRLSREGAPVFQWATIRPLLLEKVPLFVLAGLSCVVTYLVQQHGGMMRGMEIVPLGARLANALVAYAAYIGRMLWPADLAILYPHPVWWPLWKVLFALVLLAAITMAVMKGTGRRSYLAVGWLWYIGTLIPVIGIVQVGSQAMADRYTYMPLVGLFIIVAWGVPDLLKNYHGRREALAALSALCLVCLFLRTWGQVSYWHDNITLYNHALAVTGRNGAVHMNRGTAYFTLGDYRAAIEDLSRAIEIDPEFAPAHLNRGTAYGVIGDYANALADLNKALEINPRYALAYRNRAIVYGALGDGAAAAADYAAAVRIDPRYAEHIRALQTAAGEKGPEINHMTSDAP